MQSLPIARRIGISTHFLPSTHGETIYDAIRLVSEAGFAGFEIVPTLDQAQLGYPYNYPNVGIDLFEATEGELERLKGALGVFEWVTVHSPHLDWNLASANRHLRRLTWNYYERCLELAVRLGAVAMTFHMGGATWGFIRNEAETKQYHLEFAQHALGHAKPHGLPVGYEAGGLKDLEYYCERLPDWGINLDIGHAHMSAGTDEGFLRYLEVFRGRIAEVHHNGVNHYWGKFMEHQPPHLNNTLDYATTYARLREDGYAGPIVCEIQGQDIAQVIRHCQESKEMIVGLWEGKLTMAERWYQGEGR